MADGGRLGSEKKIGGEHPPASRTILRPVFVGFEKHGVENLRE
jgi:hypothetical protein